MGTPSSKVAVAIAMAVGFRYGYSKVVVSTHSIVVAVERVVITK